MQQMHTLFSVMYWATEVKSYNTERNEIRKVSPMITMIFCLKTSSLTVVQWVGVQAEQGSASELKQLESMEQGTGKEEEGNLEIEVHSPWLRAELWLHRVRLHWSYHDEAESGTLEIEQY